MAPPPDKRGLPPACPGVGPGARRAGLGAYTALFQSNRWSAELRQPARRVVPGRDSSPHGRPSSGCRGGTPAWRFPPSSILFGSGEMSSILVIMTATLVIVSLILGTSAGTYFPALEPQSNSEKTFC